MVSRRRSGIALLGAVVLVPLAGCIPPPDHPDAAAVLARFPDAVPAADLSCVPAPAAGSYWNDCGIFFSGNFGLTVTGSDSSLEVLSYNGHGGYAGTLNGKAGKTGPNEVSGTGFQYGNPIPLPVASSYACRVYDLPGEPCGLVACNLQMNVPDFPVLMGFGILPASGQAFCTAW